MYFDFAHKPAYRKIWMLFTLLATCILVIYSLQTHQISHQKQSLLVQVQPLQLKRSQLEASGAVVIQSPYSPAFSKQARQVAQLLKTDLNKAFSILENLKIPGVRLQSLALNAAQNLVEIEFELSQLSQASDVSEALMAGYNKSPWQLVSTNALMRNSPVESGGSTNYTARWQAKLHEL